MFNPFQAVGNFFSGLFNGDDNRDDEERKRRQAEERARKEAERKAQQQQTVIQPSFNQNQQPTNNGGTQFGDKDPLKIQQPKLADLSGEKPKVQNQTVIELQNKAKQQYEKSPTRDVNNYYGEDLKKLQDELAKGDSADVAKARGLMQSLDNRKKELDEYEKSDYSKRDNKWFRMGDENWREFQADRTVKAKQAESEQKKQAESTRTKEVNQFLDANGDAPLKSGRTINSFVNEFNSADAGKQAELRKKLQEQASRELDLGNEQTQAERNEASLLLTALEERGQNKVDALQKAGEFGSGIVSGVVDLAKNIGDSTRAVTTGKTTLDDLWNDYRSGKMDEQEFIKRANEERNRLSQFTGGQQDRGALDRALRAAAAGIDVATTAVPVGTAYRGTKIAGQAAGGAGEAGRFITKESLLNAGIGTGGAFREGTDTTAENLAAEAALSGVIGGVAAGGGVVGGAVLDRAKGLTRDDLLRTNPEAGSIGTNVVEDAIREQPPVPADLNVTIEPIPTEESIRSTANIQGDLKQNLSTRIGETERSLTGQVYSDQAMQAIIQSQDEMLQKYEVLVRAEDGSLVNRETGEIVDPAPDAKLQQVLAEQRDMIAASRAAQAEAEAKQSAPQVEPVTAPNAGYGEERRAVANPDAELQRLRERQAAFQASPVAPEAPAAPRIDPAFIAQQLEELGLNNQTVATLASEGASLNRLDTILRNTDWTKVDNPAGYIRAAVRRMAEADGRPNPTNAAMANNVTAQRLAEETPMDINRLSTEARNSLQNDTAGIKPDGVARSGGFVENGTAIPVEYRRLEDGSTVIVDGRHTLEYARQNGITDFPTKDVTAMYDPAMRQAAPDGGRTRMVANSNMPKEDKAAAATQLADELYTETNAALKQAGSSFEQMVTQVAEANRGQREKLDDNIEPIYRRFRAELDAAYEYRQTATPTKDGRKTKDFGNQGEYYLPQARADAKPKTATNEFLAEFDDDGFVIQRENRIDISELDTSVTPIRRYFNEMLNVSSKQDKMAQAMIREAAEDGRTIDASKANEAAAKYIELADRINETAKLGKTEGATRTASNIFKSGVDKLDRDVRKLPIVQQLNDIGELTGDVQRVVTAKPQGLTQWEKMRSIVLPDGRSLADEGYNQYRRTHAHAVAALDNAPVGAEYDAIMNSIETMYPNMRPADLESLQGYTSNVLSRVDEMSTSLEDRQANLLAMAESVYRKAAVTNLVQTLKTTKFVDKGTLAEVNDAVAPIIVNGRINRSAAEAISQSVAGWLNAGLRGFNVKSALVELTETHRVPTAYGIGSMKEFYTGLTLQTMNEIINRYGVQTARSTASQFIEQNATVFEQLGNAVASNKAGAAVKSTLDPMVLVKAASMYKHAATLRAAENFYTARGLQGQELYDKVLDDFRQLMLPSDAQSRMNFNKSPMTNLLFQYWGWNVRNIQQDFRFATGKSEVGVFADKSAAEAARRYIPAALAQKTAWWVGLNTVAGTTAGTAFGLFDPFGVLQPDYSQIDDDEKTIIDKAAKFASISPITSMLSQLYAAVRAEEERAENVREGEFVKTDAENPNFSVDNLLNSSGIERMKNNLIPGGNQAFNYTGEFLEDSKRGYDVNDQGRVRFATPEQGSLDWLRGAFFGTNTTAPAREYGDRTDFLNQSPVEAASKETLIDTFFNTRDYNRPLATSSYDKSYNEKAIEAHAAATQQFGEGSPEARKVMSDWITLGREYNKIYDEFQKNNPEEFERWISTMDDDVITPEKWRVYQGNPAIFDFMKGRKELEQRDLGRPVDPIYKLDSEKAKMVLQQRSAYTGDDMRLQEFLYQQPWYGEFKASESAYYGTFEGEMDKSGKSKRAQDWYALSTMAFDPEKGVIAKYPLVQQQKAITQQYGFGSPESTAWFDANKEAYMAQKTEYDATRMAIVNEMRKLEGVEPLTTEEWYAKIEFPAEKAAKSGGSGGGYGSGSGSRNNDRNKINYVTDTARVLDSPAPKKMTLDELRIIVNAGSRRPRGQIRMGGRSSGRSNNQSI